MEFVLSEHAKEEMERRSISLPILDRVLQTPEQIVPEHGGRVAYHSQIQFDGGRTFLVRAIVAPNTLVPLVVTVYRTLRIKKYWRPG